MVNKIVVITTMLMAMILMTGIVSADTNPMNLYYELPADHNSAIIDNGVIQLGVNDQGHLNMPGGTRSSGTGTTFVGLRYMPTNAESTAPGCLCEGWGAADATTGISGYANAAQWPPVVNMELVNFSSTASTATSIVDIPNSVSPVLRVTHFYHPSTETPNLYQVDISITNVGATPVDLRYRRVMDWDIEPTAFSEYVTIDTGTAVDLAFASDNGFASSNPLSIRNSLYFTGSAVDSGPYDHGAFFDFEFGALASGETKEFRTFYGAAADEAGALAAIGAVGAEAYSFGQSNTPDGPTLGTPNTFIFAFAGIGGAPIIVTVNAGGPYEDNEGTPITFTANASSDPSGPALLYRWDFENDGIWDTAWSTSSSAVHTWYDDHTGTAKVEVDDGTMIENATTNVTVNNVAPVVDAGTDQTVDEGASVSFSGNFTDVGIVDTHTIAWNFGDGNTDSGTLIPAHTYTDDGTYNVTLTVTDDDGGSTSDTLIVTVNNVAPTVTMDDSYFATVPITLRIAGQGMVGNSVGLEIVQDSVVVANGMITRTPGSPNEQEVNISATLDLSKPYTANLIFDTESAYSGGTPVWVIIDGVETKIKTFTTQKRKPASYHQTYEFNLSGLISTVGRDITFTGSATDPGEDDMTFSWLFGDGGAQSTVYLWPNSHSVTETVTHTYSAAESYNVNLDVTDDDGGIGSASMTVVIS